MVAEISEIEELQTDVEPPAPFVLQMSYEEFLEWTDEDVHAEWVDGEVTIMSPASNRHQLISRFLLMILQAYCEACDLGEVLAAPFQMKIATRPAGREPDVLFVAKENLNKLKPSYLDGGADVVVEIISPESQARDRGDKYYEYEKASIPEYWLIDPTRKQAEFYLLGEDGIYRLAPIDADGKFHSRALPELWLELKWLWQEPLPQLMFV